MVDLSLKIKVQVYCGDEIAMGPGKADLLDAIDSEKSISGAAKAMGMSYRRAWLLVDAMNRCWNEPLVGTSVSVGAELTAFGREVLKAYRSLQDQANRTSRAECWTELSSALLPAPRNPGSRASAPDGDAD